MVTFTEAISLGFKNYVNFSGRATRAEYWWWYLFTLLASLLVLLFFSLFDYYLGVTLYLVFLLATCLPSLAVTIRRFHDSGHSGWWILWSLIPYIGFIPVLIATLQPSVESNEYDSDEAPSEKNFEKEDPLAAPAPAPATDAPAAAEKEEEESDKEICAKGIELYREGKYEEAIEYFKQAAVKCNGKAQCFLATCYLKGQGTEKDYAKAIQYFQMSARKDNKQALYSLGLCYEKGMGVEKDLTYARSYYEKAAALGHSGAQGKLESK